MFHALSSVPAQGLRISRPPSGVEKAVEDAGHSHAGSETSAKTTSSHGPATRVEISPAAQKAAATGKPREPEALSEDQERQVQKLRQIDTEVRAHEQAHSSAGGGLAGAASYKFITGPDGKRYAVSGEVQIDASPVRDNPSATIAKMDVVIRAALAPADPSSQDQAVARDASKIRSEAQNALQQQKEAEGTSGKDTEPPQKVVLGGEAVSQDDTNASQRLTAIRAYASQPTNIQNVADDIFSAAAQLLQSA